MTERSPGTRLAVDVALYTGARLVLFAALTAAIVGLVRVVSFLWLDRTVDFPVVLAMLFALVIALPLGMVLFAPLRRRVTAGIAVVDERRRAQRADLHARLRGENPSPPES